MMKPEKGTVAQRLAKLIAAGVIASAMCVPIAAFADTEYPSVGDQSSKSASTTLHMKLIDQNDEFAEMNENIKFSVPSQLNFGAKANGDLEAPEAAFAFLQSASSMSIRAASMKVTPGNSWNFVETASISNATNAVDLTIQPGDVTAAKVSAHSFVNQKGYLATSTNEATKTAQKNAWTMGSTNAKVNLTTAGHVKNVALDLTQDQTFGTIQWYITPGNPEDGDHNVWENDTATQVRADGVTPVNA